MSVYIVISKQTGSIMGIYSNYTVAAKAWLFGDMAETYSILEFPILDR